MSLQRPNSVLYCMIDDVLHLERKTRGSVLDDGRKPKLTLELNHESDVKLYKNHGDYLEQTVNI